MGVKSFDEDKYNDAFCPWPAFTEYNYQLIE